LNPNISEFLANAKENKTRQVKAATRRKASNSNWGHDWSMRMGDVW